MMLVTRSRRRDEYFEEPGLGDWWDDLKAAGERVLQPVINTARGPIEEAAKKSAFTGALIGAGAALAGIVGVSLIRGRR